jgi:L-ribulose-5-phosphate 3-epimerase
MHAIEGDVNWPEVRKAVAEINYEGWFTSEISYGNEEHLRELVHRMQRFSDGEAKA